MVEENKYIGMCRFCGQVNATIALDNPAEAEEEATRMCNCLEAQHYSRMQEQIENANDRIDQLCGITSENYGFKPLSENFVIF